jgi:hypothetical protein
MGSSIPASHPCPRAQADWLISGGVHPSFISMKQVGVSLPSDVTDVDMASTCDDRDVAAFLLIMAKIHKN